MSTEADTLEVADARPEDVGRAYARIDPDWLRAQNLRPGDLASLGGCAVVRLMPNLPEDRGRQRLAIDGTTRRNAGLSLGQHARVRPVVAVQAEQILFRNAGGRRLRPSEMDAIAASVDGLAVCRGARVRIQLLAGAVDLDVDHVSPADCAAAVIMPATLLRFSEPGARSAEETPQTTFDAIGGLDRELAKLREVVEWPLQHPQLFQQLGVLPPKGVLLYGPPGTGKTLMAKALAAQAQARFFYLSAPEIMRKHYGESESRLREVFEKARAAAPSILFIDEIDAIAPRRDLVVGDVEKRVVAQLLTLLDGIDARGQVIVIAATNLPNSIDPALRRPGRFDREVALGIPNAAAREQILRIHTRAMPLADDVRLESLAQRAHGYTGADLRALSQEAGLAAVRRVLARRAAHPDESSAPGLIEAADFEHALTLVTPSAMREVAIEIPDTRWEDIGGLDDTKRLLQEAIVLPLVEPQAFATLGVHPPRGVVLHGPPGTGKTLLARALASEAGANFISVRGPELLSKFVGDSERAIRELFQRARMAAPCVLFFDEIDALAPRRSGSGDAGGAVSDRVVAQLLTELDGVRPLTGVSILAATNRLDVLDEALTRPGRIDLLVEVPLPDEAERSRILAVVVRGRPLAPDVDLRELARRTQGCSGADLASLLQMAAMSSLRRRGQSNGTPLQIEGLDFERALKAAAQRRQTRPH